MKRSNRLLLLLGVGLAVVAFMGVLSVGSLGGAAPEVDEISVVVAVQDLPMGTQLTAEMLATEPRPVAQATGTYGTPAELAGTVIRRAVTAGHVLRPSDFETGTQAAEIATSITAGLRGIAVSLDQVDGVGYLLQPGDYVDVMLTVSDDNPVTVTNPKYPTDSESPLILLDDWTNNTSVKVIVQGVQVLAVIDPSGGEQTNQVTADPALGPTLVAVLAVNPQQAEAVRFAQVAGDVSLILRAPSDSAAGDVITTGVTLAELVNGWGVLPPAPVAP